MKFYRIFLLIGALFTCSANGQKKPAPCFEILEYGRNKGEIYENAKYIVADRWGIHFKHIAQCLISKELKDSVEVFNHHSDLLIALKYGKNWQQLFDKETQKEQELIEKFISHIRALEYISRLDSTLTKKNDPVHYLIYPYSTFRSEKKYEIFVYGWGSIDGKEDIVCYYKFKLYRNRKKIVLVTDKPSFLFEQ